MMRRSTGVALFALGIAGAELRAQTRTLGVGLGIAGSGSRFGPAAHVSVSRPIAPRLRIGLDVVYASVSAADTGSSCGVAGCTPVSGRLRGVLHVGAPVVSWVSGPGTGVAVWFGPYGGRWVACSSPDSFTCSRKSTLDFGLAGGIGAFTSVGRRQLGLALRYAHPADASLALGGGNWPPRYLKPTVLMLLVTFGAAPDAPLPNTP